MNANFSCTCDENVLSDIAYHSSFFERHHGRLPNIIVPVNLHQHISVLQ